MTLRTDDRPVVRGRRERPRDRLPANETGLEAQPARYTSGMWAVILFVSSEAMFFGALFTAYFYLRGRVAEWEPSISPREAVSAFGGVAYVSSPPRADPKSHHWLADENRWTRIRKNRLEILAICVYRFSSAS